MNILGIIPVFTFVATGCNGEDMDIMIKFYKLMLSIAIVVALLIVISVVVLVTTKKWQIKNNGLWSTMQDSGLFQWSLCWLIAILLIFASLVVYYLL